MPWTYRPPPNHEAAAGDQAADDGEVEGLVQPVRERLRDQRREELAPGQVRSPGVAQVLRRRAEQLVHRVVPEERREQEADRRQLRDAVGVLGRHALGDRPVLHRARERRGEARHRVTAAGT